MWFITVGKRKLCVQVCLKHRNGVDGFKQSTVNSLLVCLTLVRNNCCLRCIASEKLLLIGRLGTCKVCIGECRDINRRNIYRCGGCDNICGTDTTKRDSVYLIRSRDEDKPRLENLQGNNTLSTEASCKKNEHSSRDNRCTDLGCVLPCCLTGFQRYLYIISRVVLSSTDWCGSLLRSGGSNNFL